MRDLKRDLRFLGLCKMASSGETRGPRVHGRAATSPSAGDNLIVRHSQVSGPYSGIGNCPSRDFATVIDILRAFQPVGELGLFLGVKVSHHRPIPAHTAAI